MSFGVITSCIPCYPSAKLVRGAHRGGYLGLISLEHASQQDVDRILADLNRAPVPFCISVQNEHEILGVLDRAVSSGCKTVVCSNIEDFNRATIQRIRELRVQLWAEVISPLQVETAQRLGFDALIVKGNESGGRVGEETTFILLQQVVPEARVPVYARGGVGLHTSAACLALGAAGVVLDWQLALCEESELGEDLKALVARLDGSETAIIGQGCIAQYRIYARPNDAGYAKARQIENQRLVVERNSALAGEAWRHDIERMIAGKELVTIGQDACFAASLAAEYRTVKGVCDAIRREALRQCRVACSRHPLVEHGPAAESQGSRFPILQGPMTRVSDRAKFARAIAEEGGLPFLALALLRGPEVSRLLAETRELLGERPWGAGILGFVPRELREEQLAEVRKHRPPFALIAGGRPEQAETLEEEGIPTYLHVPSPELLRMFLNAGTRRVIFEGRECGGHVGPRTSFVLWDSMVRVLLQHLSEVKSRPDEYHVVFAGGVHDAASAAAVSALAAPLVERGVRIAVLVGTAYLFTEEAVESGAITPAFQREAIACTHTVLLETGVGHATRCADTPFGEQFLEEKRRLIEAGRSREEIREAHERLNLGRLRIASRGIVRGETAKGSEPAFLHVDEETQRRDGMFMIGQVAALRKAVCRIKDLHEDISHASGFLAQSLKNQAQLMPQSRAGSGLRSAPSDIAVVGMSCILPKAPDLETYWENILNCVNAITEIPKNRWAADLYFEPDRRAKDKVYSRWGGFIDDVPFDPVRYGMPPNSLHSIEPMQLLTLELVHRALQDAGYIDRLFDRERASVIVGTGGGVGELGLAYGFRSMIPYFLQHVGIGSAEARQLIEDLDGNLPEWTEDSFAGLLLNVVAGRVANRFDLGGTNCIVDAACATSLAALRLACNELETGSSDTVIVAGVDMMQSPFGYTCFSKTQALSPTGQCRTFDESADGIAISEGIAAAVLKRLDDAERDGDHIYAVVKSVGASSDGKDKGLTAPRPIGQIRALARAYEKAGISPASVGLIEAHGTGTVVGDRTEAEALTQFFGRSGTALQSCALGSVKSMIGHTKCTAGFAGLFKAVLGLERKILPPTAGITRPNSKARFEQSPLYLNTKTRPWIARMDGHPRRAGVSAFGFGGTNFHVVLEEYVPATEIPSDQVSVRNWPAELFLWRSASAEPIEASMSQIIAGLKSDSRPLLVDLAASVYWDHGRGEGEHCLAIIATSLEDLSAKLEIAQPLLRSRQTTIRDPRGIYYSSAASQAGGVAFLFPGQGSQRLDMLSDIAIAFVDSRRIYEEADRSLGMQLDAPLSRFVFPPPTFSTEEQAKREAELRQTNVAQPALGAADVVMFGLLSVLGIQPDAVAGHSYGELVALHAAGSISFPDLIRLSEGRGRLILEAAKDEPGTMAAIETDEAAVLELMTGISDVSIANLNAPTQTVVSGTREGVAAIVKAAAEKGIKAAQIPVACAFHSNLVAGARTTFRSLLGTCEILAPRIPVYSNMTAARYAADPEVIREILAEHLIRPVRFLDEIAAMYEAGIRVFVEVGPGKVLTGLVQRTLPDHSATAINMDQPNRPGLLHLVHALGQLATAGVRFLGYRLYEGRVEKKLEVSRLLEAARPVSLSPTTWLISAGRALPPQSTPRPEAMVTVNKALWKRVSSTEPIGNGNSELPAVPVSSLSTPLASMQMNVHTVAGTSTVVSSTTSTAGSEVDSVLSGHHRLMSKLLQTHRNVVLNYLQTSGSTASIEVPIHMTALQHPLQFATVAGAEVANSATCSSAAAATTNLVATPATEVRDVAVSITSVAISEADVVRQLLTLVSERTGYPTEILGLDLDLEADLGVDSIKRVEIFGALRSASVLRAEPSENEVETVSKLKTLRAIAQWIMGQLGPVSDQSKPGTESKPLPAGPTPRSLDTPLTRMLVESTEAPLTSPTSTLITGLTLITDDGRGVSTALAAKLREAGVQSVIMRHDPSALNLLHEPAVHAALAEIRLRYGKPARLVHLMPLAATSQPEQWAERFDLTAKSLFHLVKALEPDLRRAKNSVIAATSLGGLFAVGADASASFCPLDTGVIGMVRTLAREWTDIAPRIVDFDVTESPECIADLLLAEMGNEDGLLEIGYKHQVRHTLRTVRRTVSGEGPVLELTRQAVLLVTGGARGITAKTIIELARSLPARCILTGRSPLPSAEEDVDTRCLFDDRQIRAALVEKLRVAGEKLSPAHIERQFKELKAAREIRENLRALRATGAEVEYHPVDVTDESAFSALIDDLYRRFGRIDGVVHGAGLIEDRFIRDKTSESFDRVVRPKLVGALVLARKLRFETLKFLVFYSSVSARYGNRGQVDYAAVSEALNKLAIWLNSRWPARVVSINWGPWNASGGMVTPELMEQFVNAGVQMVDPEAGCKAFVNELLFGSKSEPEVIWGGPINVETKLPRTERYFPLLERSGLSRTHVNGSMVSIIETGPSIDTYLRHHQLDNQLVMPFAMVLELCAEAALTHYPDHQLTAIRDVQRLRGIVYNGDKTRTLHVASHKVAALDDGILLDISVNCQGQAPESCYRAKAELTRSGPRLTATRRLDLMNPREFELPVQAAYESWLFHGPLFAGIKSIECIGDNGIIATLKGSSPQTMMSPETHGSWLIDPVIVDSALQLLILWARSYLDATPLPSRLGSYHVFGRLPAGGSVRCEAEIEYQPGNPTLNASLLLYDSGGRKIGWLEDMEVTVSRALNRLGKATSLCAGGVQ